MNRLNTNPAQLTWCRIRLVHSRNTNQIEREHQTVGTMPCRLHTRLLHSVNSGVETWPLFSTFSLRIKALDLCVFDLRGIFQEDNYRVYLVKTAFIYNYLMQQYQECVTHIIFIVWFVVLQNTLLRCTGLGLFVIWDTQVKAMSRVISTLKPSSDVSPK